MKRFIVGIMLGCLLSAAWVQADASGDALSNKQVFAELLDRLYPARSPVTTALVDSFIVAYGSHALIENPTINDLADGLRAWHNGIWLQYREKQRVDATNTDFPQ